jgi:hypothetical protein
MCVADGEVDGEVVTDDTVPSRSVTLVGCSTATWCAITEVPGTAAAAWVGARMAPMAANPATSPTAATIDLVLTVIRTPAVLGSDFADNQITSRVGTPITTGL